MDEKQQAIDRLYNLALDATKRTIYPMFTRKAGRTWWPKILKKAIDEQHKKANDAQ